MGRELKDRRMASTAAPSPAFLSPRPSQRADARAAASVTRTRSKARLRSGASIRDISLSRKYEWFMNARPPPIQRLRRYWEHRSGEAALQEKAHRPTAGRHASGRGIRARGGHVQSYHEVLPIGGPAPICLKHWVAGPDVYLKRRPARARRRGFPWHCSGRHGSTAKAS